MLEAQAFWRVKRTFLFASGNYPANARDTNDTPSIISILGLPTNTGQFAGLDVNSVPDQYLARAGGTVHVWRGLSAALAWRVEGMRRYDLMGGSHGWRRPGTEMFIEPSVSYTQGPHTVSFNVPLGYYYKRHANPYTGIAGDATFPRHIFLSSYALRLGKRVTASDQPPPSGPPVRPVGPRPHADGTTAPASSPDTGTAPPAA
jgi:hypothetical protein